MTDTGADIRTAVRAAFPTGLPDRLGIAVSGGGDSVAMLLALVDVFGENASQLHAVTVDHGLRPDSAREAAWVADLSEKLGLSHSTLRWRGWDGAGNLQDKARQARYSLMTNWAHAYGLDDIAVGHTADDMAETFLMRLSRSAGVDGLSAMSQRRTENGITLIRPMLTLGRQQLRDWLRDRGQTWIDDPGNDDASYERVRVRKALAILEPLGISVKSLTDTGHNLAQAREALDWYTFLAARDHAHVDAGDVLIDRRQLRTLPEDIVRRLLARAICWIGGHGYAPRSASMTRFIEAARERDSATLAGCQLLHQGAYARICREYDAVRGTLSIPPAAWDGRWALTGPTDPPDCMIRPLGRQGLSQCPDWRETGRPFAALLATPSVWRGGELLAAPLAGRPEGWHVALSAGADEFFAGILSH